MASELSNNPLNCVDWAHLTTPTELQRKVIDLRYTDKDEPLEIDCKIRDHPSYDLPARIYSNLALHHR